MNIFNKHPETQIELGKALFNLANLVAVVVFFSQITKALGNEETINSWFIFGGIFCLIVIYMVGIDFINSGEELKEEKRQKEELDV